VSARAEFLAVLRAGLRGAPAREVDEVIADYTAHFDEGTAAGRGDTDIAAALGDPLALAEELLTEQRIARWRAAPSVRSGWQVVAAAATRGLSASALLLIAVPLLLLAVFVILAIVVCVGGGLWFLFAGASLELPGGLGVVLLGGAGLIAAGVAITALATLAARLLVDALGRYFRNHHQLLSRGRRAGLST
jgi:uncharacterized membrane protein